MASGPPDDRARRQRLKGAVITRWYDPCVARGKATPDDRRMAQWLATVLSPERRPQVIAAWDDSNQYVVSVMECLDQPAGFTTLTTLTLHRHPNLVNGHSVPAELVAMFRGTDAAYVNVLGAAAINVIKDGWPCYPGAIGPNVLRENLPASRCPHVMLVPPGTFPELNEYEHSSGTTVHWLQVIPIFESERQYVVQYGYEALENLFVQHDTQTSDLRRAPVV